MGTSGPGLSEAGGTGAVAGSDGEGKGAFFVRSKWIRRFCAVSCEQRSDATSDLEKLLNLRSHVGPFVSPISGQIWYVYVRVHIRRAMCFLDACRGAHIVFKMRIAISTFHVMPPAYIISWTQLGTLFFSQYNECIILLVLQSHLYITRCINVFAMHSGWGGVGVMGWPAPYPRLCCNLPTAMVVVACGGTLTIAV